jgi:hypothetical protein
MDDYLTLSEVPEDGKPLVAGSYLEGDAKLLWTSRRSRAEKSGEPVTWDLLKETLRSRWVPRTQLIDVLMSLVDKHHRKHWARGVEELVPGWTLEKFLSKWLEIEASIRGQKLEEGYLSQGAMTVIMLAGFPWKLREFIQLDDAFKLHPTPQALEAHMRLRAANINEAANRIIAQSRSRDREEGELRNVSSKKPNTAAGKPGTSQASGQGKSTAAPATPSKPSASNRGGEASTSAPAGKEPLGEGACWLCKGQEGNGGHPWQKCPGKGKPEYAAELARLEAQSQRRFGSGPSKRGG